MIQQNKELMSILDEVSQHTVTIKKHDSQAEIQVLCLLKDGMFYLPSFLEYYRELGIKHFIFLDNGSQDGTVDYLSKQHDVSLYKNELDYKIYWHKFKKYLFHHHGKGKWNLLVDIDEFFDFPFSNIMSLDGFISYLNENEYTAVVSQMLDLFPDEDLLSKDRSLNFLDSHKYYSIDGIEKKSYNDIIQNKNVVNNFDIYFHLNGWRKKMFDVEDVMLTKHPLLKEDGVLFYAHDHFVYNANLADISCLIRHYKFHLNFSSYVEDAVKKGYHYNQSAEYKKYFEKMSSGDTFNLKKEKDKELGDFTVDLSQSKFLVLSFEYLRLLDQKLFSEKDLLRFAEASLKVKADRIRKLAEQKIILEKEVGNIRESISFRLGYMLTRIGAPFSVLYKKLKK